MVLCMKFTHWLRCVCCQGDERWQAVRDVVGRSPDGNYTLRDFRSSEFEEIVRSMKSRQRRGPLQQDQAIFLGQHFDKLWNEEYRQYAFAKCYDGADENYLGGEAVLPSSFHRALSELEWLPAVSYPSGRPFSHQKVFFRGRELFDRSKAIERLLDGHVPYLGVELKNPSLLDILRVKCAINAEEMIGFLKEWSRSSSKSVFNASISHMREVYLYLSQQYMYDTDEKNVCDSFLSDDLIFVPDTYDSNVSPSTPIPGHFYSVHNVCWIDSSTVLYVKQKYNHTIPPELPKVLQLFYESNNDQKNQELKSALMKLGVRETPTSAAYVTCLKFVSSLAAIPEKHHIGDFASIVLLLSKLCMQGLIPVPYVQ